MLAVAICLVASAFFSSAEIALTSLSPTRLRQIVDEGAPGTSAMRLWDRNPSQVLVTILIWNNVINVAASALASQAAEDALSGVNIPWVNPIAVSVGVMSFLLLTFGEITPKAVARANAERVVVPFMNVIRVAHALTYPLMLMFMKVATFAAKLTGRDPNVTESVSEEDIETMVRMARRDGVIESDRDRMLRSVFEFSETPARSVMIPRIHMDCVSCEIRLDDLVARFIDEGHSRLPVYMGSTDNIIGITYARDILREFRGDAPKAPFDLRKTLREARFVPETKPISELFGEMQKERVHMVILVDEFGGVSGLVTLEDIIEQFFGDIQDEFDAEEEWVQHLPDGTVRFDGRISLPEVFEHLGIPDDTELDEDSDVDTLAGYIAMVTGTVGRRGTTVEGWGFRFKVIDADQRRVKFVQAERITRATEAESGADERA